MGNVARSRAIRLDIATESQLTGRKGRRRRAELASGSSTAIQASAMQMLQQR